MYALACEMEARRWLTTVLLVKKALVRVFWKNANVAPAKDGAEWAVMLDRSVLKTPQKRLFTVPSRPLAFAIAAEWELQRDHIKPWTMPLVRTRKESGGRKGRNASKIYRGWWLFALYQQRKKWCARMK